MMLNKYTKMRKCNTRFSKVAGYKVVFPSICVWVNARIKEEFMKSLIKVEN